MASSLRYKNSLRDLQEEKHASKNEQPKLQTYEERKSAALQTENKGELSVQQQLAL